MTQLQGILRKLRALFGDPVQYNLPVGDEQVALNSLLGCDITIAHTGEIFCISCGKRTSKSYAQGYCFPCFQDSPECSPCIIRPDLCRAHEGFGRDMDWEREHHLSEQVVYVAWTGGMKVGVTRAENLPTRWIDQGASLAVKLAVTPNRHTAGLIETDLKAHISDRTNWRRMLSEGCIAPEDMISAKTGLVDRLHPEYRCYVSEDDTITELTYPVIGFPEKIKSVSLDKDPVISGSLLGIKGQYLIFHDGRVLNIRKHQGYGISFEA